jgi:flagellar motor switch protein FliG
VTTLGKLRQMNDGQIQNWLRKVGRENASKLGMAMLGADQEIRKLIYKNMSNRAGIILREDLEKYKKMSIDEKTILGCAADLEKMI